jgi:uncharacterized protein (TIGR02679 family)
VFDDPDVSANPLWLKGKLASQATGTAHGFDDDTVTSRLMMRALAVAFDAALPSTGEEHRLLWERAGVATDDVSGTALTWRFQPPGDDRWSVMMRERSDQGVVTHLTVQELRAAGAVRLAEAGVTVFVCENPQVLSGAARAGVTTAMLCLSGQGSAVAWTILRTLIEEGVTLRYHGDFDWPGVLIAGRVFDAGGELWRMGAHDYLAAVGAGQFAPLEGLARSSPWDARLAAVMAKRGVTVHEEAVLDTLISDLKPGH